MKTPVNEAGLSVRKPKQTTITYSMAEQLLGKVLPFGEGLEINDEERNLHIVWVAESQMVYGHWIIFLPDGDEIFIIAGL